MEEMDNGEPAPKSRKTSEQARPSTIAEEAPSKENEIPLPHKKSEMAKEKAPATGEMSQQDYDYRLLKLRERAIATRRDNMAVDQDFPPFPPENIYSQTPPPPQAGGSSSQDYLSPIATQTHQESFVSQVPIPDPYDYGYQGDADEFLGDTFSQPPPSVFLDATRAGRPPPPLYSMNLSPPNRNSWIGGTHSVAPITTSNMFRPYHQAQNLSAPRQTPNMSTYTGTLHSSFQTPPVSPTVTHPQTQVRVPQSAPPPSGGSTTRTTPYPATSMPMEILPSSAEHLLTANSMNPDGFATRSNYFDNSFSSQISAQPSRSPQPQALWACLDSFLPEEATPTVHVARFTGKFFNAESIAQPRKPEAVNNVLKRHKHPHRISHKMDPRPMARHTDKAVAHIIRSLGNNHYRAMGPLNSIFYFFENLPFSISDRPEERSPEQQALVEAFLLIRSLAYVVRDGFQQNNETLRPFITGKEIAESLELDDSYQPTVTSEQEKTVVAKLGEKRKFEMTIQSSVNAQEGTQMQPPRPRPAFNGNPNYALPPYQQRPPQHPQGPPRQDRGPQAPRNNNSNNFKPGPG